jgi:hypothetical protein
VHWDAGFFCREILRVRSSTSPKISFYIVSVGWLENLRQNIMEYMTKHSKQNPEAIFQQFRDKLGNMLKTFDDNMEKAIPKMDDESITKKVEANINVADLLIWFAASIYTNSGAPWSMPIHEMVHAMEELSEDQEDEDIENIEDIVDIQKPKSPTDIN